jgi:hypothetical protein
VALETLLAREWLEPFLAGTLARLAGDPDQPLGGPTDRRLVLHSDARVTLSLLVVLGSDQGPTPSLCGAARNALVGVMGPGPLELRRYFQLRPFPLDRIDRTRRLEDRGAQRLAPGQTAAVLAGHDVVELRASATTLLVVLEAEPAAGLLWRYDPRTLLPVATATGSQASARLEFAATALAHLGCAASVPPLRELCRHPDYVVRWSAVRALMRLDRAAGMEVLAAACADEHPVVAQAAQTAWARLRPTPIPAAA